MSKNFLVIGKKGVLVGDPWRATGFLGQRPVRRSADEPMAKLMADRWEPCVAVFPKHPEVARALRLGHFEILEEFEADSYAEACKVRDAYMAADGEKADKPPPPPPPTPPTPPPTPKSDNKPSAKPAQKSGDKKSGGDSK